MYEELRGEIETYTRRTPRSAEALKKTSPRLPLGVGSNYRTYDPHAIFVADGQGGRIRDLDGNEYIDHNLCFGTLMAGHCHPAVVQAPSRSACGKGTMFGMPHNLEVQLGGRDLRALPGGDGPLRQQWHGSDDACYPSGASRYRPRQNRQNGRRLPRRA